MGSTESSRPSSQRTISAASTNQPPVGSILRRSLERVGLNVREIAELYTGLPRDPEPADWRRNSDRIIAEAQQRVTDLKSQLDALSSGVKMCDLNRHPLRP